MRFKGIDLLCHAKTNHALRPWNSLSFLQWHVHGRDSQLAIMARYAAAAELPRDLLSFLDQNNLRIVVVNHCFQMKVAEAICKYLEGKQKPRPVVVLETHDVQATLYSSGEIKNVFRNRPDDRRVLTRDELKLASGAEMMTHVTADDMQYFADRSRTKHQLVLATIDPQNEQQLLQLSSNSEDDARPIDFLYVGNNNPGNVISIRWFLDQVVPRLDKPYSIKIVGTISAHIKATDRKLFDRFETYFVGEVTDIVSCYRDSAVVVLPTKFGTGTSIKTIEALAAGRPIVATTGALRGLPSPTASSVAHVADGSAEFASAMVETYRRRQEEFGDRSRQLYLELFSNDRYFERWDSALAGVGLTAGARCSACCAD